ncbi:hypothetical protein EYF80_003839 [Liparis tanakae]|uniref:Uncharacterized protein n=1 Tax=Liparis tanakae TaxID=230148 RepID=A0A4Z2J6H5_9TELE|nr:hypothetical protein EYF80_003839 [Liparis tanakae]
MKVVVPTGWRRASGLVAIVHRAGWVRGPGRKPVVKLLVSCFCKASLVCRGPEGEHKTRATWNNSFHFDTLSTYPSGGNKMCGTSCKIHKL